MSDIEVFEIEERFNPLEDQGFEEDAFEQESDYLPPVPDAELGQRMVPVRHTPRERIESLLVGIPGQRFRILHAVRFCSEPRTCDEIVNEVDAAYPKEASVYGSAQIVQLLERAGALVKQAPAARNTNPAQDFEVAEKTPESYEEDAFLVVTPTCPGTYLATAAGLEAVAEAFDMASALAMLAEEERYLPLYREILELTAVEGGCPTVALDSAIDPHPLAEEPRRFCGYFLGRLEQVGAIRWLDNWVITEQGRAVLASVIFAGQE